jgi:hypothetical protein
MGGIFKKPVFGMELLKNSLRKTCYQTYNKGCTMCCMSQPVCAVGKCGC